MSSSIDLVNANRFTMTVKAMIPSQDSKDGWREFAFDATFEAMPTDEWEELTEDCTKSEALSRVLKGVGDNVPEATIEDDSGRKIELSPVDVVIRNQFTCDAAYMDYNLYITKNSRDKAIQASQSKNSKRSRKR